VKFPRLLSRNPTFQGPDHGSGKARCHVFWWARNATTQDQGLATGRGRVPTRLLPTRHSRLAMISHAPQLHLLHHLHLHRSPLPYPHRSCCFARQHSRNYPTMPSSVLGKRTRSSDSGTTDILPIGTAANPRSQLRKRLYLAPNAKLAQIFLMTRTRIPSVAKTPPRTIKMATLCAWIFSLT
jgi:hypothetical protein